MEATPTIKTEMKWGHGVHRILFLYWFLFVIWQNVSVGSLHGSMDVIVKMGLLAMLVCYYLFHTVQVNTMHLLAVLALSAVLLATLSRETSLTVQIILMYVFPVVLALLCYVLGDDSCVSRQEYQQYMDWIIWTVLYMALYSLIFQTHKFTAALSVHQAYGNQLRSFLGSNHEYAMYLMFAMCACITGLSQIGLSRRKPRFYYVTGALFAVNFILTFSRTAFLSFGVFLICFVLIDRSPLQRLVLILLAAAAVLVILYRPLRIYVFQVLLRSHVDAGRFRQIEFALNKFQSGTWIQQLFGFGHSETNHFVRRVAHVRSIHNAYLQVLLTNGVVGLTVLLAVVLNNIVQGLRTIRTSRFYGAVFTGLALAAACFMLTNTPVIFTSPIDCAMLTFFAIILPKYVRNGFLEEQAGEQA